MVSHHPAIKGYITLTQQGTSGSPLQSCGCCPEFILIGQHPAGVTTQYSLMSSQFCVAYPPCPFLRGGLLKLAVLNLQSTDPLWKRLQHNCSLWASYNSKQLSFHKTLRTQGSDTQSLWLTKDMLLESERSYHRQVSHSVVEKTFPYFSETWTSEYCLGIHF